MKKDAGRIGRILWLAGGTFLCALGFLGLVMQPELGTKLTGALVLGVGAVVLLLGFLLERMAAFGLILRHVQYLTQSSEYTARLLREITEVMRSIQAADAREDKTETRETKTGGNPGKKPAKAPDAEELEFEKTLRQFEE